MGAGVALEAKKRHTHLPAKLGDYVAKYGNRVFCLKTEGLLSFPTKLDDRFTALTPEDK